jgi:hypothetical protein
MDWNALLRDVLAQLGTVAVIVAALGWIGKVAVQKFFESGVETLKAELRRRNDLELAEVRRDFSLQLVAAKADAERERDRLARTLDATSAARDRLRGEILAWSNPCSTPCAGSNGGSTTSCTGAATSRSTRRTRSRSPTGPRRTTTSSAARSTCSAATSAGSARWSWS